MPARNRIKGIDGSVLGSALSGKLARALDKRFPGEPLKAISKFVSTEIEVRIALSESDVEAGRWAEARKEFSGILGMSFEDVIDKKDLKAVKAYARRKGAERKVIAEVYKNLRSRIIYTI